MGITRFYNVIIILSALSGEMEVHPTSISLVVVVVVVVFVGLSQTFLQNELGSACYGGGNAPQPSLTTPGVANLCRHWT